MLQSLIRESRGKSPPSERHLLKLGFAVTGVGSRAEHGSRRHSAVISIRPSTQSSATKAARSCRTVPLAWCGSVGRSSIRPGFYVPIMVAGTHRQYTVRLVIGYPCLAVVTACRRYSYRLCKYTPGVNVTEGAILFYTLQVGASIVRTQWCVAMVHRNAACFQQTPLDFLPQARLVWMNGTSLGFNATLVNGDFKSSTLRPSLLLSAQDVRTDVVAVVQRVPLLAGPCGR